MHFAVGRDIKAGIYNPCRLCFKIQSRLQDHSNWTLTLEPPIKAISSAFNNDVPLELARALPLDWSPRKRQFFMYLAQCAGARQSCYGLEYALTLA